jgi:hypothetical protein
VSWRFSAAEISAYFAILMYDDHWLVRRFATSLARAGRGSLLLAGRRTGFALGLSAILLSLPPTLAAELPKAEEVLGRVAERAKRTAQQSPAYEFTRTKQTKVSDDEGNVEKNEVETYRMVPVGGKHYARLLAKNGRPLTPDELAKQQVGERKRRERTGAGKGGHQESMFKFLDKDTANRFEYEVIGREQMGGRSAYVLSIRPRAEIKARGIEEKIMARLEGRLWVDVEDAEVARIETRLTTPFRFLMGVLAVLHDFQFSVQRQRLEDGEWANSELRLKIYFRQLFETKRVEYEEVGSDFKVLPPS